MFASLGGMALGFLLGLRHAFDAGQPRAGENGHQLLYAARVAPNRTHDAQPREA